MYMQTYVCLSHFIRQYKIDIFTRYISNIYPYRYGSGRTQVEEHLYGYRPDLLGLRLWALGLLSIHHSQLEDDPVGHHHPRSHHGHLLHSVSIEKPAPYTHLFLQNM